MESNYFVYLSMVEGLVICCMLAWEIFWLKRMYQVLNAMPTAKQLEGMLNMIKSDRDSIKTSLITLVEAFEPLKNVMSNGAMGMIGNLLGMGNTAKKE